MPRPIAVSYMIHSKMQHAIIIGEEHMSYSATTRYAAEKMLDVEIRSLEQPHTHSNQQSQGDYTALRLLDFELALVLLGKILREEWTLDYKMSN